MKIAIVTPVFLPYRSGMSQVAAQEATGLAARGHAVTVFTPRYHHSDNTLYPEPYTLHPLRPVFHYGNAAWLPQLARELHDFDVVHLHYPCFGLVGAVRRSGRPIVVTYHMDVVGQGLLGLFFKIYTKLFLPRLIRQATQVIVSTLDYARSSALAPFLSAEPAKFVEIMFGVDTEHFKPRPKSKSLSLGGRGRGEGEKIILFVAALDRAHYFKGLDVLLQSIYKLKAISYKLVIVGEGEWRSSYERRVHDLDLADRVTFVGAVSDDDLVKYYQQATVLAVPSIDRSEAFSLSALQALSCGLPVVASELPGLRQVVAGHGILVPTGDVGALAYGLKKLLSDEPLWHDFSIAARQFALQSGSLVQEIEGLDKTLKMCIRINEGKKMTPD